MGSKEVVVETTIKYTQREDTCDICGDTIMVDKSHPNNQFPMPHLVQEFVTLTTWIAATREDGHWGKTDKRWCVCMKCMGLYASSLLPTLRGDKL